MNLTTDIQARMRSRSFVGRRFIHDGRGVEVVGISEKYVQYWTWPEGRGERRMRSAATWDNWFKKYGRSVMEQ